MWVMIWTEGWGGRHERQVMKETGKSRGRRRGKSGEVTGNEVRERERGVRGRSIEREQVVKRR